MYINLLLDQIFSKKLNKRDKSLYCKQKQNHNLINSY